MTKQQDGNAFKQGFTLVELSIVLVVVGLLVGGIASMRVYVRNAQLTTLMNEAKFYMGAFSQFQTRYGSPPGDYPTATSAWSGTNNGDGNGLIRANGGNPGNTAEWWLAWQHLSLGGFIQGGYTGSANAYGGATIGLNVPGAAVEGAAYVFDHPNAVDGIVSGDAMYYDGVYGNVLRVAYNINNNSSVPDKPMITAKDALKLDTKFDDGYPGSGNVLTRKYSAGAPTSLCATTAVVATARYNDSNGDPICWLILKVQ